VTVEAVEGKRRPGSEFWAVIGVGAVLAGLIGGMCGSLRNDIAVLRADVASVKGDVASVKTEVVGISGISFWKLDAPGGSPSGAFLHVPIGRIM